MQRLDNTIIMFVIKTGYLSVKLVTICDKDAISLSFIEHFSV